MGLQGDALKQWLVSTVGISEPQAGLIVDEEITGKNLLTTSNLSSLLRRLKDGPQDSIKEKVKALKGIHLPSPPRRPC
jgi:hypothetical protein